jgi:hypothetical protein
MTNVIGVRFKNTGKVYYFASAGHTFKKGEYAIVETSNGLECGEVAMENRDMEDERVNDNEFVFALPYKPIAFRNIDEYHIFGCEWTSEKIAFYLDGVKYFEKAFVGDYDVALIEGDPIYVYFDILLGPDYLPENDNIGNSLDVEYFRYYKPSK